MFTTGAFALTTLLAWFAYRKNEQERSTYYQAGDQGLPLLVDIRYQIPTITAPLGGAGDWCKVHSIARCCDRTC
jgi:hypothetical protein